MDMIATDLVELVEECHVRHLTRSQALLIQHRQNATIILKKNKSQNFSNLPWTVQNVFEKAYRTKTLSLVAEQNLS